MPNYTFPNQRVINIHREQAKSDFLGIKNENWMAASRELGAHALRLYLYLAANKNGYSLALSPMRASVLTASGNGMRPKSIRPTVTILRLCKGSCSTQAPPSRSAI